MRIYDAHIHIPGENGEVFWNIGKRIRSLKELVDGLNRWGIDKGVICSTVSTLAKSPEEFIRGNREVFHAVRKYPDRFWGACIVNPMFLKESLKELETCMERFGFSWLGELCPYIGGYEVISKNMFKVIEAASSLGYIIQVHCETEELEKIASKFPETTFVFPHLSGLKECERRFKAIARYDNYIDISGSQIVRYGILELALEIIGVDRILFGSDLIIDNPAPTIARVNDLEISKRDKEKIFWRNLDDLLRSRV